MKNTLITSHPPSSRSAPRTGLRRTSVPHSILLRPDRRHDQDYGGQALHAASLRGFTLIEIAISLVIVAVGVITLLGVMPMLLKSDRQSIEITQMCQFVQASIDDNQAVCNSTDLNSFLTASPATTLRTNSVLRSTETIVYMIATNSDSLVPFRAITSGDPLLVRAMILYISPNGSLRQTTNVFFTEIAATRGVPVN